MLSRRAFLGMITCLVAFLIYASLFWPSNSFELYTGGTVGQVRQALEDGADVNARDANGFTPLMLAVGARQETDPNIEIARLLIYHGANVHAEYELEPYLGKTALHWAVLRLPEVIPDLLDAGADIDARSDRGTPLMLAVTETANAPESYTLLLQRGADVAIENPPFGTALSWALRLGTTPEAVMSLLDAGADAHGEHALISAAGSRASAVRNSIPILKRILDEGVDVNAVDAIGQTAILSAVRGGASIETLNFLIYNGANTSVVLNNNATIWHSYALSYFFYTLRYDLDVPPEEITNDDILAILKASGVSVNQADNMGVTPLMFAAQFGTRRAVNLLIRAGADTAQRDFEGRSAYDHARSDLKAYVSHSGFLDYQQSEQIR